MSRGDQRIKPSSNLNVSALLPMLAHIARHSGVAIPELAELAGISRPTANRILSDARIHLGVIVEWRWDHSMPSKGEYSIADWGLLDKRKVLAAYAGP